MINNENQPDAPITIDDLGRIYAERQARLQAALAPEKPVFTRDDYRAALKARLVEESKLVDSTQQERIDQALTEWSNRVGSRFANARIEKEAVNRIVESRVTNLKKKQFLHRNSLVMTGNLGVGKTWTGYAYLRRLIEEGVFTSSNIIVGTETNILAPMAGSFQKAEQLKTLLSPNHKIFFIDDVGTTAPSKTSDPVAIRHELWSEIIDHCYANHIPLIITSNLSTKSGIGMERFNPAERFDNQMQAWVGRRAYDRLLTITGSDGMIVPGNTNMREIHSQQMG